MNVATVVPEDDKEIEIQRDDVVIIFFFPLLFLLLNLFWRVNYTKELMRDDVSAGTGNQLLLLVFVAINLMAQCVVFAFTSIFWTY